MLRGGSGVQREGIAEVTFTRKKNDTDEEALAGVSY
jgi:hypothetical protein